MSTYDQWYIMNIMYIVFKNRQPMTMNNYQKQYSYPCFFFFVSVYFGGLLI